MHCPEENGAFTKNVAFIFVLQRGDKRVRRPNRNGPANGLVGCLAIDVLHHSKTGIDAGPVDLFALHVETPHRRAHTLWAHTNDIDVVWKLGALVFQMPQQKTVGQTQGGSRLQGRKDLFVLCTLGGVGNQEQHHIRLANDRKHFA